jgi:hypothetical protein
MIKNIEEKEMKKYVCGVCGYVYDPAKGDSDGGIPPAHLLKNCQKIGHVLFAGRRRVNLRRSNDSNFKSKRYLCWLRRRLPQSI